MTTLVAPTRACKTERGDVLANAINHDSVEVLEVSVDCSRRTNGAAAESDACMGVVHTV